MKYIRNHKNELFFLYHPSQLPHGPIAIPSIHPKLAANPNLTTIEREYGSMVMKLDETVGIILAELENLGIADRTVVVFSADNGHELYYSQNGRCEKPYRNLSTGILYDDLTDKYRSETSGDIFNGNAGMAGLKRSNLEGGVHIPLIFYAPGIIPAGKVSNALVSNYDFLPTIAEWLNVHVKKDGISFLPQLLKGKAGNSKRYVVFGSNTGPGIVTNDGWKLRHYLSKNCGTFLPAR